MPTTVRLPTSLERALARYCRESNRTKSEVITELLEQRFTNTLSAASPSEVAQLAGFIGCTASTPYAAATAKKLVKAKLRGKHFR